jgi:hypothetical protein
VKKGDPPARVRLQVGLEAGIVALDDLPAAGVLLEPVRGDPRVGVLVARLQRKGTAVRLSPADVDEPRAVELDEQDQVRSRLARLARRGVDGLAGEEGDVVAELVQEPGEEAVQLVAEAAAPTRDDLVVDRVELHGERSARSDVEILERNRVEVREAQLGQRVEGRRLRCARRDPVEVGADVHCGRL